jgi:nicotinamidase-related amidase
MLSADDTVLVVIDVQGRLAQLMHNKDELFKNQRLMIQGAQLLGLPIILTEQYPQGMGSTIPELKELLPEVEPIAKTAFSCCGESKFVAALEECGRHETLLIGIEAHVCVWQTTSDLLDTGYEVHVAADAVSSRNADNKQVGLQKMRAAGADITCVETALFEMMRVAEGPQFKEILKLVK